MTDVAERERVALHEAGHHVLASVYGWRIGPVTIESGTAADGCSLATPPRVAVPADVDYGEPFVCWPAEVRQRIEGDVLVVLSGDVAELLFAPRSGRMPEPVSVQAREMVTTDPARQPSLPAATDEERSIVAAVCDNAEVLSDAAKVAQLAQWVHGSDAAAAAAWIAYLETQARALLLAHERRVRRLADVLTVTGTVGIDAATRLLA